MFFRTLKLPLITSRKNLLEIILKEIIKRNIKLEEKDIIVVSSKVVAISEGRLINLKKIIPSLKAKKLVKKFKMPAELIELILKESEKICGGVPKAILTLKNNILIANAGIDVSNSPLGWVTFWPKDSISFAQKIRNFFKQRLQIKIGVIIVDSHCQPLRWGTTGLALAISGFRGIIDERGKLDLYGKKIRITKRNIADNLASAANLLMGETKERTPVVIIKKAPIKLSHLSAKILTKELSINKNQCLFRDFYGSV